MEYLRQGLTTLMLVRFSHVLSRTIKCVFLASFLIGPGITLGQSDASPDMCEAEKAYLAHKQSTSMSEFAATSNSCFVQLKSLSGLVSPRLIDARGYQEYKKGHVPGSVNIPARQLPFKHYLDDKEIVVLLDGFSRFKARHLCAMLVKNGFSRAKILQDGLRAWTASGKRFSRYETDSGDFALVNPQDLLLEDDRSKVIVVDVRDKTDDKAVSLFNYYHIPIKNSVVDLFKSIRGQLASKGVTSNPPIVIIGSTDDYKAISRFRLPQDLMNIYFLKGGIKSYISQSEKARMIRRARTEIPKRYQCAS